MARGAAWLLLACAALGASSPASAAGFGIAPTRLFLAAERPVGSLVLDNKSDEPTTVQIDAYLWTQENGEDRLAETRELLVSPPIFKIAPGGSQTVRVALTRKGDAKAQMAYRVVLNEVPPAADPGKPGISLVLRVSLPVFITPKHAAPKPHWQARREAGGLVLSLANQGTAHLQVIAFTLHGPGGVELAKQDEPGYVLAAQKREWRFPAAQPAAGKLTLKAKTDRGDLSVELEPLGN